MGFRHVRRPLPSNPPKGIALVKVFYEIWRNFGKTYFTRKDIENDFADSLHAYGISPAHGDIGSNALTKHLGHQYKLGNLTRRKRFPDRPMDGGNAYEYRITIKGIRRLVYRKLAFQSNHN